MPVNMWALLSLGTILPGSFLASFRSRAEQAIIELALRQQLATYAQRGPKQRITPADRVFWVFLSRLLSSWKETLVIVQPDTVGRWCMNRRLEAIRGPGPVGVRWGTISA